MTILDRLLAGVSNRALCAIEGAAGAGDGGGGAAGAAGGAKTEGGAGDGAPAGGGAGAGAPGAAAGAPGAGADKTLAGGADAGAAAAAAAAAKPSTLPENWRLLMAGGDAALAKELERFASPDLVTKSWKELRSERDSGKVKPVATPLAKDATPEQKAQWRKDNGLPETAQAYVDKLALPDGVVIGEADKPLVAEFAKDLFEAGATQDEMNRAIAGYYRLQGVAEAQRAESDKELQIATEVALRTEWGPDFKPNMNAFGALRAMMPAEVQTAIFAARTHDGRMLGNTPELLKWGADLARQLNPAATLISPTTQDGPKAVADEIASIDAVYAKALSGDREAHRQYYGWDGKPGLEVRQRELIAAEQQMKARGRAA